MTDQSPLFRLAPELRCEIYKHFFQQQAIRVPEDHQRPSAVRNLLLTCRAIRDEARQFVLPCVTWKFESAETMFRFLVGLPRARVQNLRHATVWDLGAPCLDLAAFADDDPPQSLRCHLTSLIPLVPGLQLDTLVVTGLEVRSEDTVDRFVSTNGWRELRFLVQRWLADTPKEGMARWRASLQARDGAQQRGGSSVKIMTGKTPVPGVGFGSGVDPADLGSLYQTNEDLAWQEDHFDPYNPDIAAEMADFPDEALHASIRNSVSRTLLPLRDQFNVMVIAQRANGAVVKVAEGEGQDDQVTAALRRCLATEGWNWDRVLTELRVPFKPRRTVQT